MKARLLFIAGLASIYLTSCTSSSRINTLQPASIDLPKDVKHVVVVDNSNISKEKKGKDVVEGILTGEQIMLDRKAAEKCHRATAARLNQSDFLTAVARQEGALTNKDGSVNWSLINEIGKKENTQMIISLDKFDTDAPIGGVVLKPGAPPVQGTAWYTLYHLPTQTVFEKYMVTHAYRTPGTHTLHPVDIAEKMLIKHNAVQALGENLGAIGAEELMPVYVPFSRVYYNKGSREFRKASRLIKYHNWDLAIQTLQNFQNHPKDKIKARALFNMAVAKEAIGDLEGALELAEICAAQYHLRHSHVYVNVLKNRIESNKILEHQLAKRNVSE